MEEPSIKNNTTEYTFDNSYNVYMVVVASANLHRIQHLCFKSQSTGNISLVGYNLSTAQGISVRVNFNTGKLKGDIINSYEQQYGCKVWVYGIM